MSRKNNDVQKGMICKLGDKHFFRAFDSLLNDPAFISLTPAAQILYVRMGLASKGRLEFEFPHSCYAQYMSSSTFATARKQLIESGFITETRYVCRKNKYRFSNGWLNKKAVGTWKAYDGGKEKRKIE